MLILFPLSSSFLLYQCSLLISPTYIHICMSHSHLFLFVYSFFSAVCLLLFMGCAGSKESRRRELRRSLSPLRRSLSAETHVVALTSSTLGSLKLDASVERTGGGEESVGERNAAGLVKAKAWTVRTPTETPPNEPESIDAWELMAGLEDTTTPLRRSPPSAAAAPELERHSFSFPATTTRAAEPRPGSELSNGSAIEFDPEVLSTFRRALEELSPQHPSLLLRSSPKHDKTTRSNSSTNTAQFTRGGAAKAVLYFTSLRGVRKTFEDCCSVRTILKGYGVRVDERDVSMHGGFKEELRRTLGGCRLPSLFARGRYVGGAEEVKQMHESGELGAVLEGCERAAAAAAEEEEEGESNRGGPCEGCGDVRFVLCGRCSGSCKVYAEDGEEEEEEEEEEDGEAINGGFRRCPECNENGIVRCSVCC